MPRDAKIPQKKGEAMKQIGMIRKIGPSIVEPRHSGIDKVEGVPFRAEVQMDDGPAVLSLTPSAAKELKKELEIYLKGQEGS
jgi:hypothetical protein